MNRPDDVAIFWDYENCPVPSNSSGCIIANSITTLSRPFGSVKLFRAYLEIADQLPLSRSVGLRAELQSSGVSLIDCPHNGRKEVADKMILVDMLAFALDNPAPCTIIIISGDRDFAYALSVLKLRRYRMVLVTTANAHTTLTAQASICFDWSASVLNPPTSTSSSNYPTSSGRQSARQTHSQESSGEVSSPPEYALQPPNAPFSTHTPEPDEGTDLAYYLRSRTNRRMSVTQTAFAGRSSSQVSALERRQADNVAPTSADASRRPSVLSNGRARNLPMAGPSGASAAAEASATPSINQRDLPSTTPIGSSTSATKIQKQIQTLPSPESILSTPSEAFQGESSSYIRVEFSAQETIDEQLSSSADSEEESESGSSTAASIERPASAPSSLPSSADSAEPVWLNGAQWRHVDTPTPTERAVVPELIHSTPPPQTQNLAPDAPSAKATSSRSAGVPAFSLAAMARLQGIDYSRRKESAEPDAVASAKPVEAEQPLLPTNAIPQDTGISTSPTPSVNYATAPQTPQPEPIALSDPDRTACPSPSASTSSLPPSRTIPPEFVTLVQGLQTRIAHGHFRPLLTEVAVQIPQTLVASSPTGMVAFGQNVNQAVKAGIVEMGGAIARPWISLKPEWHDAQPAANLGPPLPLSVPVEPSSTLSQENLTGSKNTSEASDNYHDLSRIGRRRPTVSAVQDVAQVQAPLKTPAEPLVGESAKSEHEPEALIANGKRAEVLVKDTSSTVVPLDSPSQEVEQPKVSTINGVSPEDVRERAARQLKERFAPITSTPQLPDEVAQAAEPKDSPAVSLPKTSLVNDVPQDAVLDRVRQLKERLTPKAITFQLPDEVSQPAELKDTPPATLTTPAAVNKVDEGAAAPITQTKPAASTSASVTGLQVIPPHFEILVLTLQELRKENKPWPLRSHVAMLVSKNEETDTCKQAGVADFDQYIELAHNEGIVTTGGKEEKAWVGLRWRWYDAVPASSLKLSTVTEQSGEESKTTDVPPNLPARTDMASLPEQVTPAVVTPSISATVASSSSSYSSILRGQLSTSQPESPIASSSQPLSSNPTSLPNSTISIANFYILVQALREFRSKGQLRPLRGTVSLQIRQDGETYRKAGVTKFSQYIDMAVKLGIVNIGGREGDAWIELHPQWHNAMPAVKDELPTTHPIIPPDFQILVEILQAFRLEGVWGPLYSQVAPQIIKSGILQKTSITKFSQYVELAAKQGIVEIGGGGGQEWMRLLPDWYYSVAA